MDPQVTLDRIVDAIEENNRDETLAAISDLTEWMQKKGFGPRVGFETLMLLLQTIADKM